MSIIIAAPKAWAARAYIEYFGEKKFPTPLAANLFDIVCVPNFLTTIKINSSEYLLTANQFGFGISKNNVFHWQCCTEPSSEFEELVNLSWPLWEEYTKGNKCYNEK